VHRVPGVALRRQEIFRTSISIWPKSWLTVALTSEAWGASMFACHQSRQGDEFACAGWLAKVGHRHPAVRLAVASGRLGPAALEPGANWPELHDNYQEILDKLRATSNLECDADSDKPAVHCG
jgi:hypothetical protein